MVRILVHTDVTKYLEFKAVDGSYVLNKGRVEKARRGGVAGGCAAWLLGWLGAGRAC